MWLSLMTHVMCQFHSITPSPYHSLPFPTVDFSNLFLSFLFSLCWWMPQDFRPTNGAHQRCTPTVHEDVQNGIWNVCHDHVYLVYSDINSMCITVSLDKVCMTKEWYWDFKWLRDDLWMTWWTGLSSSSYPFYWSPPKTRICPKRGYLQLTWELDLQPPQQPQQLHVI